MKWLRRYHADLLAKIYEGSLYGGADKLDALWPTFVGGAIFAIIDISLRLVDPSRLILLAIFVAPGCLWAVYVLFHEVRSFPQRLRRHRGTLESERDE